MKDSKELKLKRFRDLDSEIIKYIRSSKGKWYSFYSTHNCDGEDEYFLRNIERLKEYRGVLKKDLKENEELSIHLKPLTLRTTTLRITISVAPNKHVDFEGNLKIHDKIKDRADELLYYHNNICDTIKKEIRAVNSQIKSLEKPEPKPEPNLEPRRLLNP